MKTIVFIIIAVFAFIINLKGQDIQSVSSKTDYKYDEIIKIEYVTKLTVDSLHTPEAQDYFVMKGPSKTTTISIVNGKSDNTFKVNYELRAKKSGEIIIPSPIFFVKGKEYQGETLVLEVSESMMTADEQRQKELEDFILNSSKTNGTVRYVIGEKYGYIESFENNEWKFSRELTEKEKEKLRNK